MRKVTRMIRARADKISFVHLRAARNACLYGSAVRPRCSPWRIWGHVGHAGSLYIKNDCQDSIHVSSLFHSQQRAWPFIFRKARSLRHSHVSPFWASMTLSQTLSQPLSVTFSLSYYGTRWPFCRSLWASAYFWICSHLLYSEEWYLLSALVSDRIAGLQSLCMHRFHSKQSMLCSVSQLWT